MAQTWLITGSARGLGRALAEAVLEAGHNLVATARAPEQLADLAERFADTMVATALDVTDEDAATYAVALAVERFGGLDIMFNNAGIGSGLTRFLHDDLADFDRIMAVDLFGVIVGAQRAARYMKDHGGGSIINNASIAAINPGAGMIAYRAAKAGVAHATKCMAIDLAPYGIRVNCLIPGWIMTPRQLDNWVGDAERQHILSAQSAPELLYPADVARMALWLAADDSRLCTGQNWVVDGGWM